MEKPEEKEEVFTITEHIAREKHLTKDEYTAYLRQKLDYALEFAMEAKLKAMKAQEEVQKCADHMTNILAKLIKLNGEEQADKDLEYSTWRFKEMYPKKFKKLNTKIQKKEY